MKVLIAGGAGFIGSHLVDKWINNNEVIVADRLVFGDRNIKHLYGNPNFEFINCDIADYSQTENIFRKNAIDVVYH